jgi:hypothetical protein
MTILNCSKMVSQLETQTIEKRVDAVWSRWQAAMGTRAQLAMGVNIWIIKVLWHSPLALAWRFKMLVLFDRVITKTLGEVDLLKLLPVFYFVWMSHHCLSCAYVLYTYTLYFRDLSRHGRALEALLWFSLWVGLECGWECCMLPKEFGGVILTSNEWVMEAPIRKWIIQALLPREFHP